MELSEFDIVYRPQWAIKAQGLADFVTECTESNERIHEEKSVEDPRSEGVWLIMVERSCSEQGSGAGVVIRSPNGVKVSYVVKFEFQVMSNQAEYEAFIIGLKLAHVLRAEKVEIRADSQLVCNQLNENFQARGEKMKLYLKKTKQIVGLFQEVEIKQIARADILARMAATTDPKQPKLVPVEIKTSQSIGSDPLI